MELEAHLLHVTQEMEAEMRMREEQLRRRCPLCQPVDGSRSDLQASAKQLVFDEEDCRTVDDAAADQVVVLAEGALKELNIAIQQDAQGVNSTPRNHGGEVEQIVERAESALFALDKIIMRSRLRHDSEAVAGQQQQRQGSCLDCSANCRATQAAMEAGLNRMWEATETLDALLVTMSKAAQCGAPKTWPAPQGYAARCSACEAREGSEELKALLEELAACGVELVRRLEPRGLHSEVDTLSLALMHGTTALALHLRRQIAPHLECVGRQGDKCGGEEAQAGVRQLCPCTCSDRNIVTDWVEKALQASSRNAALKIEVKERDVVIVESEMRLLEASLQVGLGLVAAVNQETSVGRSHSAGACLEAIHLFINLSIRSSSGSFRTARRAPNR